MDQPENPKGHNNEVKENQTSAAPKSGTGCKPLNTESHEYLGKRVGKRFDGVVYHGTVTKYEPEERNQGIQSAF